MLLLFRHDIGASVMLSELNCAVDICRFFLNIKVTLFSTRRTGLYIA